MRRQANLTVASVLALEALRGTELLAGNRGLGRRVGGVNIIEVPDVARWLSGREFLLSSAYLWRDRPEGLRELIGRLDELGVAALAHKPSVHVPRLPDAVLDFADELAFPVVQLPEDLAYREVFEGVYMLMFGHHRSAVGLDMAGRLGVDPNDHSMSEAIRRLVAAFGCRFEVADAMEGIVFVGAPGDDVQTRPLPATHGDSAPVTGIELEPQQVASAHGAGWVVPLVVDGQVRGRLEVSDASDDLELPQLMEIADLLSLLQIRRRAYRQGLHGALDLTFRGLARGHVGEDELGERAQVLGLDEGASWELAVLALGGPRVTTTTLQQLRRVLDRQLPTTVAVVASEQGEDDDALVLLVRRDGPQLADFIDEIVTLATSIVGDAPTVQVGRSSASTTVRAIPKALREARIALAAARARGGRATVAFDDLGAEAVLAQLPHSDVATEFVTRRLGCIEDPELLRTLELYVACHGNKTATANAIPMHRSGLLYRLRKIAQLVDADLDDAEVLNEVWLALKLRRVLAVGS